MAGRVTLEILEGPMAGKVFSFEEHDTFLFGRLDECQAHLPNDRRVSRHHFILEVNPPDACVRDLGSKNGTYVNDIKHGGREEGESPEQGARRQYPEATLKTGDQIRVGRTVMVVNMEGAAICRECNYDIPEENRQAYAWSGGRFICDACKTRLTSLDEPPKPDPVLCQKCGRDVWEEVGKARRGDYICRSCRKTAETDPAELLFEIMQKMGLGEGDGEEPEIGGYEIVKKLGAGGFGTVYLARRNVGGERVAVKVMLSQVAVDERSRKLFLREMDSMKELKHDHIVSLLDRGSVGGVFYFIMEYCEGGSLIDLIRRRGGKLTLSEAGPITLEALSGLAYAHQQNFVHRDLKLGNILLAGPEEKRIAKVTDFGLAKNFQSAGLSGMTMTGKVAGTPVYMPREQITNFKYVKPASDVWSMGATLYIMLTGKYPRETLLGQDPMEAVLHGRIVPIGERDSSIPNKVADVIDCALDNNVKNRYQDADEMRKALVNVL